MRIFSGDDLGIYSMNMEYGILKNCLLTQVTIPLQYIWHQLKQFIH